jgi:hypothetical protein
VIVHKLSNEFGVKLNAARPNVNNCDDGVDEVGEERSSMGEIRGEDFEDNLPEVPRSRLKEAILKRNVLLKVAASIGGQFGIGAARHIGDSEPPLF